MSPSCSPRSPASVSIVEDLLRARSSRATSRSASGPWPTRRGPPAGAPSRPRSSAPARARSRWPWMSSARASPLSSPTRRLGVLGAERVGRLLQQPDRAVLGQVRAPARLLVADRRARQQCSDRRARGRSPRPPGTPPAPRARARRGGWPRPARAGAPGAGRRRARCAVRRCAAASSNASAAAAARAASTLYSMARSGGPKGAAAAKWWARSASARPERAPAGFQRLAHAQMQLRPPRARTAGRRARGARARGRSARRARARGPRRSSRCGRLRRAPAAARRPPARRRGGRRRARTPSRRSPPARAGPWSSAPAARGAG